MIQQEYMNILWNTWWLSAVTVRKHDFGVCILIKTLKYRRACWGNMRTTTHATAGDHVVRSRRESPESPWVAWVAWVALCHLRRHVGYKYRWGDALRHSWSSLRSRTDCNLSPTLGISIWWQNGDKISTKHGDKNRRQNRRQNPALADALAPARTLPCRKALTTPTTSTPILQSFLQNTHIKIMFSRCDSA